MVPEEVDKLKIINGSLRRKCRELGVDPPVQHADSDQQFEWIANRIIDLCSTTDRISEEGCNFGKYAHLKRSMVTEFLSSSLGKISLITGSLAAASISIYYTIQLVVGLQ